MTTYGLLLFEAVEELDFVGPWQVFTTSSLRRNHADTVVTIAEHSGPVRCNRGMRVLPDHTLDDHPALDVLLVPGGGHSRIEAEMKNHTLTDWIRRTAAAASWVTSDCTGAFLLHAAGVTRGRRVATERANEDVLEALGDVTVVRDARYVVDGNLVTSQGVSAGIDMSLWLIGKLHGRAHARDVIRTIQYEPAPPYQADDV
ncbi:DJ-1/PfpI family protein [Plantactinospora mayteni]|uniref:AraC family transcriptional regulator n=1 Tax=Plantactinospora mayteni TaxID=566021 RepID=A0ABQ4EJJ0_9ACTN|nr:DJ-1/PfpI family protein [Plantactinospora mayteni]GIG94411.1 AraC family transcriptional regulator [Plantactinospora mayteni]